VHPGPRPLKPRGSIRHTRHNSTNRAKLPNHDDVTSAWSGPPRC